MNSLKLLRKYQCWVKKKSKLERSDRGKYSQWRSKRKEREIEIVQSLFNEIPTLTSFSIVIRWNNFLSTINNEKSPVRILSLSDETKAWLIEINLKFSEVQLLMKVMPQLRHLIQDNNEIKTFTRQEFAP